MMCAMQLYAAVKERMEEMQLHNMSWIEVQFLKKAVDVLCQCRQTLMYTYVFAFYLRKNNQSIIFEVRTLHGVILVNIGINCGGIIRIIICVCTVKVKVSHTRNRA